MRTEGPVKNVFQTDRHARNDRTAYFETRSKRAGRGRDDLRSADSRAAR